MGRVAGVFGVQGWLKVYAYTRPAENIFSYTDWWLVSGEGETEITAQLLEGRTQGRGLVARIGIDGEPLQDRDRAAEWVGAEIQVVREALPLAPEGSYYWADLVGLEVRSESASVLGRVTGMTDNGAQDVMVVEDDERQRLIPFVIGPIIKQVDLEEGILIAAWEPEY